MYKANKNTSHLPQFLRKFLTTIPTLCLDCSIEMELIDTCFDGSDSYPIEEPLPVEPPNIKLSQQERMQLIITLIKDHQNSHKVRKIKKILKN
jgi:hypothetical protein